jgi:hypothetical protein
MSDCISVINIWLEHTGLSNHQPSKTRDEQKAIEKILRCIILIYLSFPEASRRALRKSDGI